VVVAPAARTMTEIINNEMHQIKMMIAQTVAKRDALKNEMQSWYESFPDKRFNKLQDLFLIDVAFSQLDSQYKRLWDFYNVKSS
jgi:uncharacterized protein